MGAFSAGCHDHNDPIKCDKRLGGVPASTADADNSGMAQPPNSRPTVPRTEATGKASDFAEVDAEVGTSAGSPEERRCGPESTALPRPTGASAANGRGVPMGDGGTSYATTLAIALRRCCRPVRSAREADQRLSIIARLRHVRRWSEDADHITGEVARDLAIARTHISAGPPHAR